MMQYEDLPEEYRMYQISNKMVDTLDELRFEKTFLQGPTSSGGGLWITNEITIHKKPIESKVALMDTIGLNIRYENLRAEYPEVGGPCVVVFPLSIRTISDFQRQYHN